MAAGHGRPKCVDPMEVTAGLRWPFKQHQIDKPTNKPKMKGLGPPAEGPWAARTVRATAAAVGPGGWGRPNREGHRRRRPGAPPPWNPGGEVGGPKLGGVT